MINLFPITQQLAKEDQTYENCMKFVFTGLMFVFVAYLSLTLLAVRIYGDNI